MGYGVDSLKEIGVLALEGVGKNGEISVREIVASVTSSVPKNEHEMIIGL